ncbi:VOC family protein [Streptomyces sp. NBC_00344]|uniref:VOC family protein n=1 Tax=Streptomyces sp. NBC_00344 TaxID=2975720 RepID=UPI002E2106A6
MGSESASSSPGSDSVPADTSDTRGGSRGMRPASLVTFVRELDPSVEFYRELLLMEVTTRAPTAALLTSADGWQLYLRAMGSHAEHSLGAVGIQYVIWTAADRDDLLRCERLLKARSAHVSTRDVEGLTLVEGRDPSHLPLVVSYPGPDQAVRHEIISRIYAW